MLSENIRALRNKKGLTQKELADLIHVTPQAVSRWESGDVEPSVTTMQDMAKIFGVSMDELVGTLKPEEETAAAVVEEKEELSEEELDIVAEKLAAMQKPVLAVCEQCNKPIYEGKDIVRKTRHHGRSSESYVICTDCDKKNKEQTKQRAIEYSKTCRRRSYIWSGIASAVALAIFIVCALKYSLDTKYLITGIVAGVLLFPFLSCLFLKNNFVGEMVETVASWGFVTLPGIIFEFSLDGIIWLLTVKLLLWILGIMLAAATTVLGAILGMVVSPFVYPFALHKSFTDPEATDTI